MPSIYTNAQLPQLPQIGNLSMSPTEPSYRHDGMGMGPQNNNIGHDSRPGAASIVSPVSQATSSRNASISGGLSGHPTGPYRPDGPSSQPGMSGAFGATRSDHPASGPGATTRQDVLPTGPQGNDRFQNSQAAPNGSYPQSHAMKDPRVPSNNPRLDTSRQPRINTQNSGTAPSSFGTPGSRSRADGPRPSLPPLKPVFGVSLDELFRRDGSAVPMIVHQCVQAVDLFGLDTEGIYRTSGSAPHIMEMKALFDHGEQ
jgi:RhoGAP domain